MHPDDTELHSIILRNMAEGVCLVRISDLTIVYANPRFEQIFGYDPGELAGRPVSVLNYAEDEAGALAVARTIIAGLEPSGEGTYEVHNRKKDGTPFWCRARTSRFDHPTFGPVWVAVQGDITAEKDAIGRLRRHEKLLSCVFETIPVGLWIADGAGRIVHGNPAGEKIWGGARLVGIDEFAEYQAWRVDTGARLAAEDWGIARALLKGETSVGELLRIRGFDGVDRTILNAVMPLRDEGALIGALAVNEDVTRLMEAEALSAGVVAAAPDAIVATDGERRIAVFNAGAEHIFGHACDQVLGRDLGLLVAPDHHDALEALLAAAAAGQAGEPRRLIGCRRSGEAFPAEASAACTHSGLLRRYTLVLRDITARVRAEEERARLTRALADERAWLRALIATAPVALATLDLAGEVTANPRAEEMIGLEVGGLPREAYAGIVHHLDGTPLALDELPLSRALRGEPTNSEEYLVVRPDGSRRWALGSAAAVIDADGHHLGAIGSFVDITAQKQHEADLRFLADAGSTFAESLDYESTLQTLVDLAVPRLADGAVVYLADDAGALRSAAFRCADPEQHAALASLLQRHRLLGWNQGACEVVRSGQPVLRPAVDPGDLDRCAETEGHREALRRVDVRSYLTVPLRARETTIGAITLFDARSGRRVGQRELDLIDILGRRAGLAIDKARLYRESKRATQARDNVLSLVAHDLRNPLSAILYAVDTVARCLAPDLPQGPRAAAAIKRSATQMLRMIGDLLDVARLDAGTLALERAPLRPAELVAEAVEAARPLAEGLELTAEVPGDLPAISADHDRVLQVLANLLGNAIKFTPHGGRLAVLAERSDGAVLFHVRDSGPGIPSEQLEHIFDRFWQADRTDRRGAGLGLAIVQGIVEAHGGRVWAQSRPGEGTTFHFTLPIARA